MNSGKWAIFTGLAAGVLFVIVLTLPTLFAVSEVQAQAASPLLVPGVHAPSTLTTTAALPRPLSAVVVTSCSLAVALFIQLDPTHLLRADPRQSDMFTAVDGKMVQSNAGPMPWEDAYKLAQSAVLSSHVVIPCTDGPRV